VVLNTTHRKMAEKSKTREITIIDEGGRFNVLFRKLAGEAEYDFEGISLLRKLLSNEKARLLHVIKKNNPKSIYELARVLKRDFKSVSGDIKLLEKFGFLEMIAEKTGKRGRLKPRLAIDSLHIYLKF
jgi:predicted transcriptional regulator